jgi:hypothetical protein
MGLRYLGSAVAWEEPNFYENGCASVKLKYLRRVVSSEAGALEQY